MRRPPWALLLLWLVCILPWGASAAEDERRVALVIGIGAYANAPRLANPARDAQAVAETLGGFGFEVDLALDPDYRHLSAALREFGRKAEESDLALIFFSGHGIQVAGQNFLIPTDASLERERDLAYETLPLNLFLGELGQARRLGLMILDTSRPNPFAGRLGQNPGLSRIDDTPSDVVVASANRADAAAEDGGGEHSPYARALLDELQVPGLELGLFLRRVRDRVHQATNGRQEPYTFGSPGAEPVYLNPLPPNRPPVASSAPPVTVTDDAGPMPLGIPTPTDPDGDQLVVQVTGLPRGGTVSIGNRALLIGDYLTAEQLKAASFHPDGRQLGEVGSFDYAVSDGRGGTAKSAAAITVIPSNHPPVVASETVFRAVANRIALPRASDQDGDPLTVRVRTVPERGKLRHRDVPVEAGDRLDAAELGDLTFDPEGAPPGTAGRLAFTVEDGRGGEAEGVVVVEVTGPGEAAQVSLDEALWQRLEPTAGETELRAFLALFPQSPFAAEARARLGGIPVAAAEPPSRLALARPATVAPSRPQPEVSLRAREATAKPPAAEAAPKQPPTPPQPTQLAEAVPPQAAMRPSATRSANGPGSQDCPDCPVIVPVPAGRFTMGRNGGDHSERPAREVIVAKPFGLGRYEVTVGQWKACAAEGGCPDLPRMKGYTDATPVYNVTHDDALAYAAWLSRITGQRYRLPSEAEWEYAARAGTTTPYWWGEKIDGNHVLCRKCGSAVEAGTPPPVSSQPPNPWGLVGMSGGVREWLADCWLKTYDKAPADTRPRLQKNCRQYVTRGGSWLDAPEDLTLTKRGFYDADVPYLANGFRVARDLE